MRNVKVEKQMRAPREDVWRVLADFPNIADWNSGVKASFATGAQTEGIGATRHCDLAPLGQLEETVRGWDAGEQLVISIDSASRVPIKHGMVTFDLDDESGGTRVSISYEYQPKYGFVGQAIGGLLDRQLTTGFTGFLDDLETEALAQAGGAS